jgi:CHAT domain-containing protein/tetratricopeptide (TPR) repeat protein
MLLAALTLLAAMPAAVRQGVDDPSIRAAVERFYAAQQAEDLPGYLALWSKSADRPREEQLRYIFGSGDDRFSDIVITRVTPAGSGVAVRVSVTRDRTVAGRNPGGPPTVVHMSLISSLSFVREDGEWKLVREGSATDGLASALIQAATPAERDQLLAADADVLGPALLSSMSREADALSRSSRFKSALIAYERVREIARKLGSKRAEAGALQNIGNTHYFARDLPAALEAFGQRLAIEREIGNDEGIAGALLGIATIRYSFFEYTEALGLYREALAIQERLDDRGGIATTLVSTGNILFVQGDFAGAVAEYRRSRDLCRALGDTSAEARALEGLGRAFAAQGDLTAAREAYAGVLEEARARGDRSKQGTALLSIGEIHFRLGNFDTARPLFDDSRAHFEAVNDMANVGRVWQAAALTDLVAGRLAAAEREFVASGTACASAKDDECVARSIVGLAYAQASQEKYEIAIASYGKAIAAFAALKQREEAARAEVGLSQAQLGIRNNTAALATALRARDQAAAISLDDVLWRARVAEARAQRRLGRPLRAMAAAKDAVGVVQRMAQAALERPGEPVAADSEAAYAMLAVLQAEAGDAAGAFTTAERRRAHTLRLALATNERDIVRGMTPAERDEERLTAAELVSLRAQLGRQKKLPKPDAARIARLEQSVASAAATRNAARKQLFTRLPDLRVWRGLAAAAGPDDAAAVLQSDGSVIVEFVIDDEDLLASVVVRRGDRTEVHAYVTAVSRQTLAQRIAHALEPAVLQDVEAWRRAAADLLSAIPAPLWSDVSTASHVVIVPDGVLWRVPFEALPVGAGSLADATTVAYAGSVTSLTLPAPAREARAAVPLLAVGAPDLPAATRDRVNATAPGWALRAPEAADAEIRAVTQPFAGPPAAVLAGSAATEAALRAQAPGALALHLAAPFRMNGASPLFSPLLLAADPAAGAERTAENDGVLEAREVMNLDLHARVVVMSDGAAASMRDGAAAAESVGWAWRAAGVPALVMPRWAVDGDPSTGLLGEFYQRVHAGDAPDRALQAARAVVRAREETRAPYDWASWMVIGR